jgi:chemotaxis-related protein WspD
MIALPLRPSEDGPVLDCWNRIGIHGDRSCSELQKVVHCQNCPVFAAAGRRFLDAPSPPGYREEWTERLAAPLEEECADHESVLVFRLADEWLALPVSVLVEVTPPRPLHRVPFRGGLLAGLVNIRGELGLCVHLDKLLGIGTGRGSNGVAPPGAVPRRNTIGQGRLLVVARAEERWVFPVDAVDQVGRLSECDLGPVPPTLGRAVAHLTAGVFPWAGHAVGLLEPDRLFEALRTKLR